MENSMNPSSSNQTTTPASNLWQPNTVSSYSTQLPIDPMGFNNFFTSTPSQTLYPPATPLSLPSSQSFQSQFFPPSPQYSSVSSGSYQSQLVPRFASSESFQSQFFPSAPLSFVPTGSLQPQFLPPAQQSLPSPESFPQLPYAHPVEHEGLCFGYPPVDPFPANQNGPSIRAGDDGGLERSYLVHTSNVGRTVAQERILIPDPNSSELARIMASPRSLNLQIGSSAGDSPSMQPSAADMEARRFLAVDGHALDANNNNKTTTSSNKNNHDNRDLYVLHTPENKRLRVLLTKQLKNSDVGKNRRVVLPKREAEKNLPTLYDKDKDGIPLVMRDVYSNQEWTLIYKFWQTSFSRMYLLHNTGEFVRQMGMESGDLLIIYEDEGKNYYFSVEKGGRPSWVRPLDTQNNNSNNHSSELIFDEEEETLAILIEQLIDKENPEADGLIMSMPHQLDTVASSSYSPPPPGDYQQLTTVQSSHTPGTGTYGGINFSDNYASLNQMPFPDAQ